jgi:hypothetical protein
MSQPARMFRLKEALLGLTESEDGSRPSLETLQPGCVLELVDNPQPTGLVNVVVEEKRYTVFYPDVQQRAVPLAPTLFRTS